ncbi:5-(carboxyamino)imidazole ribonucleotide synthase [Corticimicrobacter populi]|uniref:N5-carboxyaminoimidazole ribonucleotide synthase n=1 Tax=Corticimicrobacter populi TaxID=2175229 RepID=A0A2V1K5K1_9BURK|nr:5-(carboxyamino)imidazole ribonucleotide synthase [Corticimicrobacter populi]PWF24725.1 5-(carboxyamino)imidazole ribonucleotide synthase [Corticimicrobacter populi]
MTVSRTFPYLVPGQWLGVLGGGQLGRMFCQAAQDLGYQVAVLDPAAQGPAAAVADRHLQAAYDDEAALAQLAGLCKAVTTEFENVPADSLRVLAEVSAVSPSGDAVAVVQDRIAEKTFISSQGIPVAPWTAIRSEADLDAAPDALFPGILKVARLGYDGKGQAHVVNRQEALAALAAFDGAACVLEALQPLDYEISVVLARGHDGEIRIFPAARNEHRNGILAVSEVGASLDPAIQAQAHEAARALAQGLDYRGVLCIEFFVLQDGRLLVNEIAPRPHNSGHYTMDACLTSQFEQQARVMAGLPLGDTSMTGAAIMLNLLGDIWFDPETDAVREPDWRTVLAIPGAKLHLYGKRDARKGRKMGHVNCVAPTLEQARAAAAAAARALGIAYDPA